MGIIRNGNKNNNRIFLGLQRHVARLATNPSTAFSVPQAEILHGTAEQRAEQCTVGTTWTPRPTNPPQTTRLFAAVLLLLRLIATCELFHAFIATAIQSRYLYNLFQQLVLLAAAELRDLVAVRLQIIIMWLVAHTHTRVVQLVIHTI